MFVSVRFCCLDGADWTKIRWTDGNVGKCMAKGV